MKPVQGRVSGLELRGGSEKTASYLQNGADRKKTNIALQIVVCVLIVHI